MRKSGEKPYLEGIASAPSTGPHSINVGSGNRARAANRRAAVPHFAEKGSEGPPNKAKPAYYITPAFAWTLIASLVGCFQSGAVPVLLQKWPPHPRWRSARRSGVGVPVCTAAGFFSESGGIRPAPFSAFRFCFGFPALCFLAGFGCAARRMLRCVSGKGVKKQEKGLDNVTMLCYDRFAT